MSDFLATGFLRRSYGLKKSEFDILVFILVKLKFLVLKVSGCLSQIAGYLAKNLSRFGFGNLIN